MTAELGSAVPIPGFEGLYEVTRCGHIVSCGRPPPLAGTRRRLRMVLKPWLTDDGYLRVSLSKAGRKSNYLVHVLVAEAFVERPPGRVEVNHIDCVKSNATASNLEWLTRVENMAHAKTHGLRPAQAGDTAANIKLDSTRFQEALRQLKAGGSVSGVAADLGVNRTTILNARRRAGVSTKRGQYTSKETHDSKTFT